MDDKKITPEQFKALATQFGIDEKLIRTVILVESSGHGFDPKTGKILIQFEPRYFLKYAGISIQNGVEMQAKEYEAFEQALKLNPDAAYMSTSFGLAQIMGFNHEAAGFKTAKGMYDAFVISEENQIRGMLNFIKSEPQMFKALITHDWATFASHYNGPQYLKFKYDTRLAAAYKSL